MRAYISYFIVKFRIGLTYRAAAIAGILTQIFFGLVYISIYVAFYESDSSNTPITLTNLVAYLWLNQAFLSLINTWFKNSDIAATIKNGNLAYELTRPIELYHMWGAKILGEKLSAATLKCIPVIIVGLLMPGIYKLRITFNIIRLILFIITLSMSAILVTLLILFFHIIIMYTLDDKGIANMYMLLADLLAGGVIPIPFFPDYIKSIIYLLPFRYIADFPFRLFIGDISYMEGLYGIGIEILWIVIIYISSKLLMKHALSKVVIQGG